MAALFREHCAELERLRLGACRRGLAGGAPRPRAPVASVDYISPGRRRRTRRTHCCCRCPLSADRYLRMTQDEDMLRWQRCRMTRATAAARASRSWRACGRSCGASVGLGGGGGGGGDDGDGGGESSGRGAAEVLVLAEAARAGGLVGTRGWGRGEERPAAQRAAVHQRRSWRRCGASWRAARAGPAGGRRECRRARWPTASRRRRRRRRRREGRARKRSRAAAATTATATSARASRGHGRGLCLRQAHRAAPGIATATSSTTEEKSLSSTWSGPSSSSSSSSSSLPSSSLPPSSLHQSVRHEDLVFLQLFRRMENALQTATDAFGPFESDDRKEEEKKRRGRGGGGGGGARGSAAGSDEDAARLPPGSATICSLKGSTGRVALSAAA